MAVRRQHPDDPAFARLTISTVGLEFGLPYLTLDPPPRGSQLEGGQTKGGQIRGVGKRQEIFARQLAAYLCQTVFDMSVPRVAQLFSRDRTTIIHALRVVEDSRDDPVFNRKLMKVESFLTESLDVFRGAA